MASLEPLQGRVMKERLSPWSWQWPSITAPSAPRQWWRSHRWQALSTLRWTLNGVLVAWRERERAVVDSCGAAAARQSSSARTVEQSVEFVPVVPILDLLVLQIEGATDIPAVPEQVIVQHIPEAHVAAPVSRVRVPQMVFRWWTCQRSACRTESSGN